MRHEPLPGGEDTVTLHTRVHLGALGAPMVRRVTVAVGRLQGQGLLVWGVGVAAIFVAAAAAVVAVVVVAVGVGGLGAQGQVDAQVGGPLDGL